MPSVVCQPTRAANMTQAAADSNEKVEGGGGGSLGGGGLIFVIDETTLLHLIHLHHFYSSSQLFLLPNNLFRTYPLLFSQSKLTHTMSLKQESQNKAFDGTFTKFSFNSLTLGGLEAKFNVFLPSQADSQSGGGKVPVIYYLAGLTCTEDTGAQKGAFLAEAAKQGVAVVFPDTSPRGANIEGSVSLCSLPSLAFD